MSTPTPNVKVYDRPESKIPKPAVLVIILVVVAIVGFLLYKAFYHPAVAPAANAPSGLIRMTSAPTEALPQWAASRYSRAIAA